MSRVHVHDPADPRAQGFACVGVSRGLQHPTEPAALQQIRPAQALNAATAAPARVFNLADRGHTAPGQRADLMLVSGDPLTDITATRAIERIWRAGVLCDRRAFVADAAEAEALDAFDARVATVVAAVRERRYGFDPSAAEPVFRG